MARKATIKTFYSSEGEVFEGTEKALLAYAGITSRSSLYKPNGAYDKDNVSWRHGEMPEERTKKKLFTSPYRIKQRCFQTGKTKTVTVSESDQGDWVLFAEALLLGEHPHQQAWEDHPEYDTEGLKQALKELEREYEIIYNLSSGFKGRYRYRPMKWGFEEAYNLNIPRSEFANVNKESIRYPLEDFWYMDVDLLIKMYGKARVQGWTEGHLARLAKDGEEQTCKFFHRKQRVSPFA